MNKKNIISLLVLAILAVAIPLGLNLARQQQTLKSSATEAPITFSGDNAEQRNGVWVVKDRTKPVTVTFTSPLGPPPVATNPAMLRSVSNPSKKKVSFSFPSLVKEVYAVACGDNPPGAGAPSGFKWKANCGGSSCYIPGTSTDNKEAYNANCPKNTFDPANVSQTNSNWCYGFGNGDTADFRCLMYVRNGCETAGAAGCAPAPTCQSACTWTKRGCAENGCSQGERSYTASCTISGCDTSRCESDRSCSSTGGGSSNTYVDPGSGNAGQSFQVTATATSSCASGIGMNFGGGLTGCRGGCGDGGVTDGCSNNGSPKSDGKPYWWRWTCTGSTAGSYTASFNASGSSCSSSTGYTISAATVSPSPSAPPQSCSITGDFDGNGSINLADYEKWKSAFINGNTFSCTDLPVDLVLFNTWRTEYSKQ